MNPLLPEKVMVPLIRTNHPSAWFQVRSANVAADVLRAGLSRKGARSVRADVTLVGGERSDPRGRRDLVGLAGRDRPGENPPV